jgi:hypothetical protein
MTKTRGTIYAIASAFIVLALWHGCRRHDQVIDAGIKAPILKPTEQTKVIVDPRRHTIITVTRAGDKIETHATFLPSSGASVSVGLDKSVLVTARSWGTEVNPFVGCAFGSDIRLRAAVGLDLFYVQRWEVGGGLLLNTDIRDTRAFAHVSYNAYNNIYVAVGIDNKRTAHIMAGLKF